MNYSHLELTHEAEVMTQFEINLLERGFIIHCKIENVKLDSLNRPYEQTPNGKIMLSNRQLIVNKH
jgi:hypothetical protein